MRIQIKKFPYRTQVFAGILMAALLPIGILGSFSCWTYITELSEKMDIATQSIANQTRDRVDSVLTSIQKYYVDVPKNAEVRWLLTATEVPYQRYTDVNAAGTQFRGSSSLLEYIAGYTFINRKNNFVITNYGMFPYSDAANRKQAEEILAGDTGPLASRLEWYNNMANNMGAAANPSQSGVINLNGYLLVMRLPPIGTDVEQALIVNLDMSNIYSLLTNNLEKYSVVVLDRDARVFAASDLALADYCKERYEKLCSQDAPILADVGSGRKYRIAVAESKENGLTFIVGYNQALVEEGADRILVLIGVLSATIVLLLILSRIGALWIYRPVSRLIGFFNVTDDNRGNEFDQIKQSVEQLVGNNHDMERIIDAQREMLIEMFMVRLFRGELTTAQITENVQRLHLEQYACYYVLACRLPASLQSEPDSIDENAMRILFLERLPKALREYLYAPAVNNANSIIMILAGANREELETKTGRFFEALEEYTQNEFFVMLCVGVSAAVQSFSQIRSAFLESVEALKSNFISKGESVIGGISYYEDIRPNREAAPVYNESREQEIRLAIDRCDRKKAAQCTGEFIDSLPGWATARHEISLQINCFLTAILTVLYDAGLSVDEIFKDNGQTLYKQVGYLYDSSELKDFFIISVIEPSIRALEAFRESSTPMMRIRTLVRESRGDITMTECAERLGWHPSHIWRILKTQTGMSFSAFVSQEKLEAATEMLLETDLPVTEIAEALHYTNAQNFIRFFSKHKGVTPGKFRNNARQEEKTQ